MAGCQRAEPPADPNPVRVENNVLIVPTNSAPASSITLGKAEEPHSQVLAFNARLVWDENVTTRLFTPMAGRVTKINVEAGQWVKAGDVLASLASPDYGQAQADARRAGTDLALAERTVARIKDLFGHGAAAEKELQSAEADLERAKLEKQRTAERLALYGSATNSFDQDYLLKTPISGVVVDKNISPGSELRSDLMLANTPQLAAPLFIITDPKRLWIQIDVPERDHQLVKTGQVFQVRSLSLPERAYEGRVDFIADTLDPVSRTIKIRGSVLNPERLLKAEMFVKAEFRADAAHGSEIPTAAVFLRGTNHCVLVEQSPGHYSRRTVQVGGDHGGKILVTDGLQPGEQVVVDGAMFLEQLLDQGA
jgi:cobalt-zinc-cadmium efflux system membrane fusion protein